MLSLMWGIMCGLFLLKIDFLFMNIISCQLRRFGPVEIVEKINSNAYRLMLPSHIRTADIFNVKHLVPFIGDSLDDSDSRSKSVHPGENDMGIDEQAIRLLEK